MGMKVGKSDDVTIVGGRPMHRAVETKDLPQGVEQVLTLAGLDPDFRAAVAVDPVAAAAGKGIELDPVEAGLLRSMPAEAIAQMADRMIIPRRAGRRTFVKALSASVVAMVTGNAFMLCSGCTGADMFEGEDEAEQHWMTLAGYTCLVCIPRSSSAASAMPVMVALHGEGETCLSSAQRWQAAGREFGFCLVAINWTQDARLPAEREELVGKLDVIVSELATTLAEGNFSGATIDESTAHLSCRGEAADMLFQAALLGNSPLSFKSINLLGGAPSGDWHNEAESLLSGLVSPPPSLYYVIGDQDSDYAQGKAFAAALEARGVKVKVEEYAGLSSDAILSFGTIWGWMTS